jgi:hypothetical protein
MISLRILLFIGLTMVATTGHILLYSTVSHVETEAVICVYHVDGQTIEFCHRLGTAFSYASALTECQNGGKKWTHEELLQHNITPWQVLWWSSSVEKVDDYARLYFNPSVYVPEKFLCNCTREGSFGKSCEFQLPLDLTSFSNNVMRTLQSKVSLKGHQLFGSIWCYETLFTCDYGMLCLDWRNICDGQQECLDGYDEENCDILEFNECEDGEYRCTNGMCIDEEYWLDGKKIFSYKHSI